MLKGFLLLHIWVEFHRWSSLRTVGAAATGATGAWRAGDVDPSTGAGREGCSGPSSPPCTGGSVRWRTHLSPHLPSPSSAARREQTSPAGHPGVLGSRQPPRDPPAPRCPL